MKFVEHVSKGNSIVGKVIVRNNGGKENGEKEVHEDVVTLYNPTSYADGGTEEEHHDDKQTAVEGQCPLSWSAVSTPVV